MQIMISVEGGSKSAVYSDIIYSFTSDSTAEHIIVGSSNYYFIIVIGDWFRFYSPLKKWIKKRFRVEQK